MRARQQISKSVLAALVLLATGCASGSHSVNRQLPSTTSVEPITAEPAANGQHHPPTRPDHRPATVSGPTNPASPAAQTPANPAVGHLLQQAAQARAMGDYARAQTLAERAQGLAPHDARSYLELSRIYQARGDHVHARQMARRGLSVSDGDPELEYDLQLLSNP